MTVALEHNPLIVWYRKTPDRQRRRAGLLLVTICFSILLLRSFLVQQDTVKTALQVDFERYVDQAEQAALAGTLNQITLPRIHVAIEGEGVTAGRELLIDPLAGDGSDMRVLRLLSLAREARLFGFKGSERAGEDSITFRIEDGIREFAITIHRVDIHRNVQAELLMKLLSVHGKPVV